jgi:hypothetical protein
VLSSGGKVVELLSWGRGSGVLSNRGGSTELLNESSGSITLGGIGVLSNVDAVGVLRSRGGGSAELLGEGSCSFRLG